MRQSTPRAGLYRARSEHSCPNGWKSKANGELLALAAKAFEVFVTTDRNLSFQQNVQSFGIAVVVVRAHTNRLTDLRPIVPALLKVLPFLKKGEVREIGVYQMR